MNWATEMVKFKGKRILVADDEPSILRIVQMVLAQHGLSVITAEDGHVALQKAVTERPDAILLDVRMPGMDGFEVCSKLKTTEATADIPIGFLTADKELESYKLAQQLGGMLYITKPFKPERLVDFIGVLLSSLPRTDK